MAVESGQPFPSFSASSQEGETVDLSQYRGDNNLVVFFYPRANTSGCVQETTEFSAKAPEFEELATKIVGVSVDAVRFQQQHAITCAASFPLLSDKDKVLTGELGILSDRGMAKRTTYVLDRSGTVRQVFNDVNVDGHVDEVLAAVKQLAD